MLSIMQDGVVRRHVDARLVSYALSILSDPHLTPEVRMAFTSCAAGALQAASGLVALGVACKSAASSPVLGRRLNARQLQHVQNLLEGIGATIEESWKHDLKELLEMIVVLAAQTSETVEDELRFRTWAQGVFLDTRPMMIVEDDVRADIEIDDTPAHKRNRVRKPRSSKEMYQSERLENLVARAVAMGVTSMHPVMAGGQIQIVGSGAHGREEKLLKLRGSMNEAKELCESANEEIRKMDVVADAI